LAFHQRNFTDDGEEPVQDLPELKKGDELKIKEAPFWKSKPNRLCFIPKPGFCRLWKPQERNRKRGRTESPAKYRYRYSCYKSRHYRNPVYP
jgi:hypothetical protein